MNVQTNQVPESPRRRVVLIDAPGGRTVAVSEPVRTDLALRCRIAELEAENAALRARAEWLAWLR